MLKQEWFTEENIKKFSKITNSETQSYSIPFYIQMIRECDKNISIGEGFSLIKDVTQPSFDTSNGDYLLIRKNTINGTTLFEVNQNFDWSSYRVKHYNNKQANESPNDEYTLLKTIASLINKEFKTKHGLFKSTLPTSIVGAMNIWNEKYNKGEY